MATIKISDIEALLNLPVTADIELYEVPQSTMLEFGQVYGGSLDYTKRNNNTFLTVKSGRTSITLNTVQKTWK
jgi:hypothetical protein